MTGDRISDARVEITRAAREDAARRHRDADDVDGAWCAWLRDSYQAERLLGDLDYETAHALWRVGYAREQDRRRAAYKLCRCCGAAHSVDDWHALRLVGTQPGDEHGPSLELRDCACGSTLAVEVAA